MSALGRVVVVGASLGGVRTIRNLRRRGFDGPVTLIGAEDRLAYDRPPLSKGLLTGQLSADRIALEREEFYADLDLRLGIRAVALRPRERTVELSDDTSIVADHVVIATGASPRRLPNVPQLEGLLELRTLDDALTLRSALEHAGTLAVVGAGFIGSEVAASARALGVDVTVVEALPAPVVRGVGPVIGGILADLHRTHGVDLRVGQGVAAITDDGHGRATGMMLSSGERVESDVVLVAIGVTPRTGWLEDSGLRLEDGVVCDDRCRAIGGDGHVWAVGDVARWPSRLFDTDLRIEHWTNAADQGAAVALQILGHELASPYDPVPYVWTDQYDAKIQVLGRVTGDDDVDIIAGSPDGGRFLATYAREGVLRGVVGMNWPKAVMSCRSLIASRAPVRDAAELAGSLA